MTDTRTDWMKDIDALAADLDALVGKNADVFTGSVAVPNAAAAGSNHDLDVPLPAVAELAPEARYAVMIYVPAGAVATTVRLRNRDTLGGAARFFQVASYAGLAADTTRIEIVQGWLLGDANAQFRVSPDALVGVAGAYDVHVRVRRL